MPFVARAPTVSGGVRDGSAHRSAALRRHPSWPFRCRRRRARPLPPPPPSTPARVLCMSGKQQRSVAQLRRLLRDAVASSTVLTMPCCFDGLSAKLVEQAGFPLTFMSGFSVAGSRGLPDTGLLSYGEMRGRVSELCEVVSSALPVIADGDTGYGNAVNVKRTVQGYMAAGAAGVLIEDQVNPKRCGHTRGKAVVDWDEAMQRVRAAVDARREAEHDGGGDDVVIVARTDARQTHGMDEALRRLEAMRRLGADVLFLEAPRNRAEMARFAAEYAGSVPTLANMLEDGLTPVLPPAELQALGYTIAAYPLTLMSSAIKAMRGALGELSAAAAKAAADRRQGRGEARRGGSAYTETEGDDADADDDKAATRLRDYLMPFRETQRIVGFDWYDAQAQRYAAEQPPRQHD